MIDDMIALLGEEQIADDDKKAYCAKEFDESDDEKKSLERAISQLNTAIADTEAAIDTLTEEISALEKGIKDLDKQVAEATDARKQAHATYVEELAANKAADELLGIAKNRLLKFYSPKMYKAPPKRELTEEQRITVNMGGTLAPTAPPAGIAGTGISAAQVNVAPPPPPEANLAYKKSGESSNGVLAMIDLLVADLDKEIQTLTVEEKDAQADYEVFMEDSSEKRALDSKAITDKEAAKAAEEEEVQKNEEDKKSKSTQLMETDKTIADLHAECDWLLKHFDARKAARAAEVESLEKAKDVLAGADYSLVQMQRSVHLRGARHA